MVLSNQTKQLILENNKIIINDTTGHLSPFISKIDDLTSIEIFLPEDILDNTKDVYVLFKTSLGKRNLIDINSAKSFRNCYSEKFIDFIEKLDEFADYFPNVNNEKKYYTFTNKAKKSKKSFLFISIFALIFGSLLSFII